MKNYFFGWTNIKKVIKDLYDTLSSKKSFLSSKRIERFVFTSVILGSVITYIIYGVVNKTLTALDITIVTSPLLVAAGYNMSQTEKAKKEDGQD